MDRFGHVVVPYSPWFTFRESLEIATGELHPVRSAFAIRYNTVLNLWDPPDGERVRSMLQQSLDQFQTSQRVRQLEDMIAGVAWEASQVPTGCLLGLPKGDDLLEDYRQVNKALTSAQGREKRIEDESSVLALRLETSTPWPEPGRQALRRVFRSAPEGLVAHLRELGWGVYLGASEGQPIGRFLVGDEIVALLEYRQIDHLTEHVVQLPEGLLDPAPGVVAATEIISAEEIAAIWHEVAGLDLPDLDAQLVEHRAREEALVREDTARLAEERAAIDRELATLHAERAAHPCHICERRKEHRDLIEQADKLIKEQRSLEAKLEQEIDAEEERIRGVIRGIRNV
ncbi:MAG: DNA helicase, partial [Chloroflexota bacterium]